jgi:hypothetical protein
MPVYALSIFSAAFLLFLVQPLIAKFILPWFGGGAAVWTACLLFFQVFLLLGYAYAHCCVRYLGAKAQAAIHVALLCVAIALLPITPSLEVRLSTIESPTAAILVLLAGSIGLQYLLLAATSPLLQHWFARTQASDMPYRLYSLSNVGSLLALLAYPLVVEPRLPRGVQALSWSWAFAGFAVLCSGCALGVWRRAALPLPRVQAPAGEQPRLAQRLVWLAMPVCASVLLLAVTNKLTQDVAPVPFLWVLPLALYLLSFVVCFDNPRWYSRRVFGFALMGCACWVCLGEAYDATLPWQIAGHAALLLSASMVCHGEVYRRRPAVAHLTSFYLTIALGGAIGGLLVAVVAPLLYTDFHELPLGMLAALQLLLVVVCFEPGFSLRRGKPRWAALSICVCFFCVAWACYRQAGLRTNGSIYQARNFYGVLTVYDVVPDPESGGNPHRRLVHGEITHGAQFFSEELRRYPTTYYNLTSGIGLAFEALRTGEPLKVGAIGLGAGTVAAYGEQGDELVFYEINPEVLRIALGFFSFLTDTPASVSVVLGDARISLASGEKRAFDLLILDAFSGDAIPVHLLTTEAFALYLEHMAENGVIAVHISNNYLELTPVVIKLAQHFGLGSAFVHNDGIEYASKWLLLTHDRAFLRSPVLPQAAAIPDRPIDARLWTDDDTNLFEVLDL